MKIMFYKKFPFKIVKKRNYYGQMATQNSSSLATGMAIGALAVWFFTPDKGEQHRKEFGAMLKNRSNQVQSFVNDIFGKTKEIAIQAGQSVNDAVRKTGQTLEETAHKAADKLDEMASTTHKAADEAADNRQEIQRRADKVLAQARDNNNSGNSK